MFKPPPKTNRHWNGVVTIDGVSASWHCTRPEQRLNDNHVKDNNVTVIDEEDLLVCSSQASRRRRHLGAHLKDVRFKKLPEIVVAIDPGHQTLIAAVRESRDGVIPPGTAKKTADEQTKSPRRRRFDSYQQEQLAARKLSQDILGGKKHTTAPVVWGNGGFGPTSREVMWLYRIRDFSIYSPNM